MEEEQVRLSSVLRIKICQKTKQRGSHELRYFTQLDILRNK